MTDFDKQAWIAIITFGAILYGSAFEVGYFESFGIEFLSLAGVADWIFSVSIIGIFAVCAGTLILGAAIYLERRWHERIKLVFSLATITCLLFAALAVKLKSSWAAILSILFLAFACCFFLAWMGRIYWEFRAHSEAVLLLAVGAFFGAGTMVAAGAIYERTLAGRECTFTFRDGQTLNATYMRSIAEGHLARSDGKRYYFPRNEVRELSCDAQAAIQFKIGF